MPDHGQIMDTILLYDGLILTNSLVPLLERDKNLFSLAHYSGTNRHTQNCLFQTKRTKLFSQKI